MKNKLFNFRKKKSSIPLLGLSMVLSCSIICGQYSHALTASINVSGGTTTTKCNHKYQWSLSGPPHVAKKICSKCDKEDPSTTPYSYSDPSITNFTLTNPTGITAPGGNIIYESGVTLPSTLYSISASHNDIFARNYTDSLLSQTVSVNSGTPQTIGNVSLANLAVGGSYTLSASVTDRYYKFGNTATSTKTFYIGPYPTIYYNVHLTDDNNPSYHHDNIKITNIKLLSTYLPNSLTFYICDSDHSYTNPVYTISANRIGYSEYKPNGVTSLGYLSTFEVSPQNTGKNIQPLKDPYIMVRVNDGRPNTESGSTLAVNVNPNITKWAKFENLPIFATI